MDYLSLIPRRYIDLLQILLHWIVLRYVQQFLRHFTTHSKVASWLLV